MTDHPIPPHVEARLQALEARIAHLEGARAPAQAQAPAQTRAPSPAPAPAPAQKRDFLLDSGEGWLGRVGIALLVVGMILLFRYAVERGWLTPEMRIAIGLVAGAGLLGAGAYYFVERRLYRQILMGGGIVILFITGLAAVELYHLISGTFALAFFLVVAGTAFRIASRQNESVIASIAASGALIPPSFLLADAVPGSILWLYLAIVIAWTGLLLALRGWQRPLVFAAFLSIIALFHRVPDSLSVQVAATIALAACWLCYAALPLVRARFSSHDAARTAPALLFALPVLITFALGFVADEFVFRGTRAFEASVSMSAWMFAAIAWWLRALRTAGTPIATFQWRGEEYRADAYSAAVFAFVLALTAAIMAASESQLMFPAAATIAALAFWNGKRLDAEVLTPLAHAMFAVLGLAFLAAGDRYASAPAFDEYAVAFAAVAVIAAWVASGLKRRDELLIYYGSIYFVAHVLMATELAAIRSAPWLASLAYGAVGSVLLIHGLSARQLAVQRAGMISLALLVGRLFLYDLANVDVGVRIVLFMVFGFAFLGLSYLVKARRFIGPDQRTR